MSQGVPLGHRPRRNRHILVMNPDPTTRAFPYEALGALAEHLLPLLADRVHLT
jgi:hypothetical protein